VKVHRPPLDMANACEMAETGCKASAAEVAALRAGVF
jgi:hypothetical protein